MEHSSPLHITLGNPERTTLREESFLNGLLVIRTRDGLHPSERAILPLLPVAKRGRALVVGSRYAVLGFALRQLNPDLEIVCHFDDAWEADHARELLSRHPGSTIEITLAGDPPAGPWHLVVLPLGKKGVADVVREQIRIAASQWLAPGGLLISSSDTREDRFVRDEIKKAFGSLHIAPEESRKGGVGYIARRPARQLVAPPRTATIFEIQESGQTLRFFSRQGVFCADRLDPGTRALLAVADVTGCRRILDLGSGCGVVGILAGLRAPEARITFLDSSARAVDAVRQNLEQFGLAGRSEVLFSAQPAKALAGHELFDCVLTNPPYYGNWRIAESFVETVRQVLAPGGRVFIVTKSPEWYREQLTQAFHALEEEKRGGYSIVSARRKR